MVSFMKLNNKQLWKSVWVSFSNRVLVVYVIVLGIAGGILSIPWLLNSQHAIGSVSLGAWVTWPDQGTEKIDPYSLAVINNNGDIPLGAGEGVLFKALTDSNGLRLMSSCQYVIGSTVPSARYWTMTFHKADGKTMITTLERKGFTSTEIIRDENGEFEIYASSAPHYGNWMQLDGKGNFEIFLRLYDLPASFNVSTMKTGALPEIIRKGCAS